MPVVTEQAIMGVVGDYGYGAIAVVVGLECMGLPLPGETMLVAAAIYAGTIGGLEIGWILAAAAAGAIIGDNCGYWLGRRFGTRLVHRLGSRIGLGPARVKLGQYLFLRHGGKVVFLGRFVALLRMLAPLLAGANRMAWPRFLIANAVGGIGWTAVFGLGAFLLGDRARRLSESAGTALLIASAVAFVGGGLLLRRHHRRLEAEAERALPNPRPE